MEIVYTLIKHAFIAVLLHTNYCIDWPLDNAGLNSLGPLTTEYFSVVNPMVLNGLICGMWRKPRSRGNPEVSSVEYPQRWRNHKCRRTINRKAHYVVVQSLSSDSVWSHGLQHTVLLYPSLSSRVCSNSCALSRWCHPIISSFAILFSFAFNLPQHQGLFQWVKSLNELAKVLELQLQHHFFQWIFRFDFL